MTLFDECREALSDDFYLVEELGKQYVMDILNKYPFTKGNVVWSKIKHSDYESIDVLLRTNTMKSDYVFVFADDVSVPIFRTKLSLISENIYDVIALSPKIFIFNDELIIQPLFPTEMFRVGVNK